MEPPATPAKRWVCKGSATAELLLTVRGSSCREREPGSANTNTQIAENKMCGRASWLSISSTQGAHCSRSGCNGGGLVLSLRARAFPEMPPWWSWAAPPGSGQERMAVPGGRNGLGPPCWSEKSSQLPGCSSAAFLPCPQLTEGPRRNIEHLLLLWRGACVESDSCNQELLTEHSKGTLRAGRAYLHRHEPITVGPLPAIPSGCSHRTALSRYWQKSKEALSSHGRFLTY